MKSHAIRALRQKLAAGKSVFGLWVTLESASITEMGVALGLDRVVIDAEHGHLDWHDIVEHIRAAVRSDTVILVRIAELNGGVIKRVLDIGADGVVVPWVESAEQLEQAVAYCNYPLKGLRGIGAERATGWGRATAEHVAEANDHVLVVPIIESVRAGQNIHELVAVPGVELLLFWPVRFFLNGGFCGAMGRARGGRANLGGQGCNSGGWQELRAVGDEQCQFAGAARARLSHVGLGD